MTESEWLSGADLALMFGYLIGHPVRDFDAMFFRPRPNQQSKASGRQLRLYSIACYRAAGDHLSAAGHRIIEAAEKLADGPAGWSEVVRLKDEFRDGPVPLGLWSIADDAGFAAWMSHQHVTDELARGNAAQAWGAEDRDRLHSGHAALAAEIFGNPFRLIPFDSSWRTEAAVALAIGMYKSLDFAAMPVLADALEDAGCTEADILDHCRSDGPHARGCWVVDLILGQG